MNSYTEIWHIWMVLQNLHGLLQSAERPYCLCENVLCCRMLIDSNIVSCLHCVNIIKRLLFPRSASYRSDHDYYQR